MAVVDNSGIIPISNQNDMRADKAPYTQWETTSNSKIELRDQKECILNHKEGRP